MNEQTIDDAHLYCGDALAYYEGRKTPTVIVCDSPYGVKGFPCDLVSHEGLAEWYVGFLTSIISIK